MNDSVYYNENDERAAAWLRALIVEGVLPDGEVDTRSIVDVRPADLAGFRQCHFFAGIGGWAYALQLAGWPADRDVWTGSCPCQPWSVAGKSAGADDPRHLWPTWERLIRERRPATIFGEQVASQDGLYWLDLVYADLEARDYAIGAVDLPAACVGAPHGRARLWFVAHNHGEGCERIAPARLHADGTPRHDVDRCGAVGDVDDTDSVRRRARRCDVKGTQSQTQPSRSDRTVVMGEPTVAGPQGRATEGPARPGRERATAERAGEAGRVADTDSGNTIDGHLQRHDRHGLGAADARSGFWSAVDWIPCIDGRARPVEPGTFPLAHGLPARVGRLRGYGNAIVPQVAAEVIAAYLERCP